MVFNQAAGNLASEASNHVNLGMVAEARQAYDTAEQEFARALELDKAAEHRDEIAADLLRLGRVADRRGFPDRGLVFFERAYHSYLAQGDQARAGAALTQAVVCAKKLGRDAEVTRLERALTRLAMPSPAK